METPPSNKELKIDLANKTEKIEIVKANASPEDVKKIEAIASQNKQ